MNKFILWVIGIGLLFSPTISFNKVDFPTFGLPGSLAVDIPEYFEHEVYGWVYRSVFDLEVNIAIVGRQRGSESILLEEYYFTSEFWQELRQDKKIEMQTLTTHHLGMVDDGPYEGCDYVRFTDIKLEENNSGSDIKDMEFTSIICEEVKGLGAVTIDMKGRAPNGFKFKAGFDITNNFYWMDF